MQADNIEEVVLHLGDWNYQDKYYQLPKNLLVEFKERIEKYGLHSDEAWQWFVANVNYDDETEKPIKFGVVDMSLNVFFLDWENEKECMEEWSEELGND
jgi:hypothetical protein